MPFRLLYISIVDLYKHQWNVVEAVAGLRRSGAPVALDLVGPAYPPALRRLRKTMVRFDPKEAFVRYIGPVPYAELAERYGGADAFVFASSCENMPNILLEAMAAGLPIACSSRGPMPEVLGDAGLYFDPESPDGIEETLGKLLERTELRTELARNAHERAKRYSWERCAGETFSFIAEVCGNEGHLLGVRT
jgi:glycosyltransferase involved in cell wall biosynthesis